MLTLGCIDYINTLPLFAGLQQGHISINARIVCGTPSDLNARLLAKELDCSLISSVAFLQHRRDLQLIAPFGIAARGAVQSVILYTKEDPRLLDGKKIGLTPESASSVELLKVLATHLWQVHPIFETMKSDCLYDAFLLIGDAALMGSYPGLQPIDLAEEWFTLTGHSFPFAVLAANKGLSPERCNYIQEKLLASHAWGEQNRDALLELALNKVSLSKDAMNAYFDRLIYPFTDLEYLGLATFERYLSPLQATPRSLQ